MFSVPRHRLASLNVDSTARLLFVGDLHGEIGALDKILYKIGFSDADHIVATGDLIDRGTDSEATLRAFRDRPNFHSVVGNHEHMMYNCLRKQYPVRPWYNNGGMWSFHLSDSTKNALADICESLPHILTIQHRGQKYGVTHAGLPHACYDWDDIDKNTDLLWQRDIISNPEVYVKRPIKNVNFTVQGHTPIEQPMLVANRAYIDTGAYVHGVTLVEFINGVPYSATQDKVWTKLSSW